MRAIRSKDTTPELIVRQMAYRMGYRYRLHVKTLPGKPDLVFSSRRKVILRHANLSTTQRYLGTVSDVEAMRWIDNLYG